MSNRNENENENVDIFGVADPLQYITETEKQRELDIEEPTGLSTGNILAIAGFTFGFWVLLMFILFARAQRDPTISTPSVEDMIVIMISLCVIALLFGLTWNSQTKVNQEQDNKLSAIANVVRRWLSDETQEADQKLSSERVNKIRRLIREERQGTNVGYCEENENPCFNGGRCVSGENNTFSCVDCNYGWIGKTCNESDLFTIDERCKIDGENQANIVKCEDLSDSAGRTICSSDCPNMNTLFCESTQKEYETVQEWIEECPEHPGHPRYCTIDDVDYDSEECRNWRAHCDTDDKEECNLFSQCSYENDRCSFKE